MNTTATETEFILIKAEEAPLGVQLYPTRSPEYAPNFTLAEVSTVRGPYGTRVIWTYESGTTRTFDLGEEVACKLSK
jgi:hypothetical protein